LKKIKILTIVGTRPEVIKLGPFINAVEADSDCLQVTCATTQHKELQDEVLNLFTIQPKYNLHIMKAGQDLFYITEAILPKLKKILEIEKPDFTVVQGDTTTAFVAALSSFYCRIPVVHIEAGLRTHDIYNPYPEEVNRSLIARLAYLHIAPTPNAVNNLLQEGITKNVFQLGNTIVDAVDWILKNHALFLPEVQVLLDSAKTKILITLHRRENFGLPLIEMCRTIKELAYHYPDCIFIWPVHPNPNIKDYVLEKLSNIPNIKLLSPLSYGDLICLLNACVLILSDSGGIQEEACILAKKILILRDATERPEVIAEGLGILTGINRDKIFFHFEKIIAANPVNMPESIVNPYGKPGVSKEIIAMIKQNHHSG